MHSHHSHSGQFCQHAANTLEEMVLRAIELRFDLFCATEHMPRYEDAQLYPEERASGTSAADLARVFKEFVAEARRLQQKYQDRITILVGFESEALSAEYADRALALQQEYQLDFFVGSLHHTFEIPIDFDQPMLDAALARAGSVPSLYKRYFAEFKAFVERARPPVVGHLDLIRLFTRSSEFALTESEAWEELAQLVDTAVSANSLFELNSSAVRKGLPSPYPQRDVAELILLRGGRFCLSDDSHNVGQVGLNYSAVLEYVKSLNVDELWRLASENGQLVHKRVHVREFEDWVVHVKPPRS